MPVEDRRSPPIAKERKGWGTRKDEERKLPAAAIPWETVGLAQEPDRELLLNARSTSRYGVDGGNDDGWGAPLGHLRSNIEAFHGIGSEMFSQIVGVVAR
jgi:hypothetical protein